MVSHSPSTSSSASSPRQPTSHLYESPPSQPTSPPRTIHYSPPTYEEKPATSHRESVLDSLLPVPTSSTSSRRGISLAHSLRRLFSIGVITLFGVVVLWKALSGSAAGRGWRGEVGRLGIEDEKGTQVIGTEGMSPSGNVTIGDDVATMKHDWSQYRFLSTLSANDMPGGSRSSPRRVIMIGDIHGSWKPLQRLLDRIHYDSAQDTIIHVGDILAKGPDSLRVISFMRKQGALGVRGNHDQKVIEWRAWMERMGRVSDVGNWEAMVDELDGKIDSDSKAVETLDAGLRFPTDWEWKSQHWTIARRLPTKDYDYLVSLPLTIHIPSIHSIIVHAGLLARDLSFDAASPYQPFTIAAQVGQDRSSAELTILKEVPANRDPYNLLNMRSVKNGKITKSSKEGTPWSELWAVDMERCTGKGSGLEGETEESLEDESIENVEDVERRKGKLPKAECSPVTAIYGHAAGRGLDIKEYSKGLDSACVYGKQLTALVLGDVSDLIDLKGVSKTHIGNTESLLVDVDCKKGGL